MNKNKFAALALILPILAACTDDGESPQQNDRIPLSVSAGINMTRAADATWHQGDAIGVYSLISGTDNIAGGVANYKYINATADGASASFSPADEAKTAYYPTDGSEVDIMAYYPHGVGAGLVSALESGRITVKTTDQTSLPAIDLMTATKVTGKSQDDPAAALEFEHRLTKLNITLVRGEGADDIDLADAQVTLSGTPGTAVYNLYAQQFESFGQKADIELSTPNSQLSTNIIVPTPAGSGVTFVVEADGRTFNAALPEDVALGTGEEANITIRLKVEGGQTAAGITATIKPWTGGPTEGIDAIAFDMAEDPETGVPAVTTFQLWKNADEAAAVTYSYNAGGATWSASPEPFYVDDIAEGDRFSARHTPTDEAADPVTGVKDILEAGPAALDGKVIPLVFHHVNARLTVNLVKGSTFPANTELTNATISILGHTLTGPANTVIVEPAEITTATTIIITVDGKNYTCRPESNITLAADTDNTLTFTLGTQQDGKTILGMKVTIDPWNDGATESLTAIHIYSPADPETGVPAVTTFDLWKNAAISGAVTYTYNAQDDTWGYSGTPFYMEDIAPGDMFYARFTPADRWEVTGLQDIIATAGKGASSAGEVSLEFTHILSKFRAELSAGTGLDAGLLAGTTVGVIIRDVYTLSATNAVTAGVSTKAYTFTAGTEYLVVPQTVNNMAVSVTLNNGKTYSGTVAAFKLEPGLVGVLKITVNATDIGIKATVKDWEDNDPTGGEVGIDD